QKDPYGHIGHKVLANRSSASCIARVRTKVSGFHSQNSYVKHRLHFHRETCPGATCIRPSRLRRISRRRSKSSLAALELIAGVHKAKDCGGCAVADFFYVGAYLSGHTNETYTIEAKVEATH